MSPTVRISRPPPPPPPPPLGGRVGEGGSRGEKCRQQCASHDPHPCPLPTRGRGTQEPKGKTFDGRHPQGAARALHRPAAAAPGRPAADHRPGALYRRFLLSGRGPRRPRALAAPPCP